MRHNTVVPASGKVKTMKTKNDDVLEEQKSDEGEKRDDVKLDLSAIEGLAGGDKPIELPEI